jgi:thymidylate synthase
MSPCLANEAALMETKLIGSNFASSFASFPVNAHVMALSKLVINDEFWNPDASLFDQIEHIQPNDFFIKDYQSHPTIKAPLSN